MVIVAKDFFLNNLERTYAQTHIKKIRREIMKKVESFSLQRAVTDLTQFSNNTHLLVEKPLDLILNAFQYPVTFIHY